MSIIIDSQCLQCHLRRNLETARSLGSEETATAFAKALMELYLSAPADASSPWLSPGTSALFQKFYGLDPDRFQQEKLESNRFVLDRIEALRQRIQAAPDPVYAGLQLAVLGNYIDFSALQGEVSFEVLDHMLTGALEMNLDRDCYAALCRELSAGKRLLYLTDNAGEIGFDRIFAEELYRRWPHLEITFCVRGGPAMNDATREDARAVGIPFPVIDNGTTIAGTDLTAIGPEARRALAGADVILSKGQGNAETLLGCGYNIYYAFLIKCVRFSQLYGKPKLTPMLIKERAEASAPWK